MGTQENDKLALFEALQAKGWHLEDDCLYSPSGGAIRMQGNADVPGHMVETAYRRTKGMLDELLRSPPQDLESEKYKNHIRDLEGVVAVLKEFLDR